jgi:phage I-like protein
MVVDGIAESPHETWMESEDKVSEMILEKLKMDHRKIEVEHAHRTWKTHHPAQVTGLGR